MKSIDYFIVIVVAICLYFLPLFLTRYLIRRRPLTEAGSATYILIYSIIYPAVCYTFTVFSFVIFPAEYSADLAYAAGQSFFFIILALVLFGFLGYRVLHGTFKEQNNK